MVKTEQRALFGRDIIRGDWFVGHYWVYCHYVLVRLRVVFPPRSICLLEQELYLFCRSLDDLADCFRSRCSPSFHSGIPIGG